MTDDTTTLGDDIPAPVIDPRPRMTEVACPVYGRARIRRMEPEQLFAQLQHFERANIDPGQVRITKATRPEIARLIQRCVIWMDSNRLMFPGVRGHRRVMLMSDDAIETLATQIIQFQEL